MSKRVRKAYKNEKFLNSRSARPIRILAEYLEPESRFKKFNVRHTIVFFGSSKAVPLKEAQTILNEAKTEKEKNKAKKLLFLSTYYEKAKRLSKMLTEWSIELGGGKQKFFIATGGGPGIMEAANRGAVEAGGESIGLNISLPEGQVLNEYVSKKYAFEFHYFFMRKFWFLYLAKCAIIFPGGYGTLDEMFEILMLIQTKKLKKSFPVILMGEEYWRKLIDFEFLAESLTIDKEDLDIFRFFEDEESAFSFIKSNVIF